MAAAGVPRTGALGTWPLCAATCPRAISGSSSGQPGAQAVAAEGVAVAVSSEPGWDRGGLVFMTENTELTASNNTNSRIKITPWAACQALSCRRHGEGQEPARAVPPALAVPSVPQDPAWHWGMWHKVSNPRGKRGLLLVWERFGAASPGAEELRGGLGFVSPPASLGCVVWGLWDPSLPLCHALGTPVTARVPPAHCHHRRHCRLSLFPLLCHSGAGTRLPPPGADEVVGVTSLW